MIESGPIMHIDPERRLIGLHLYDGFFKVIPVDSKGHLKDAFNIRLEELQVLDIQFLHGFANPTIVLLYQDSKEMRHVKTYEISIKDKDLVPGPWHQTGVELGASMIIPVPSPLGGCILLGEQTISYLNKDKGDTKTIHMDLCVTRAWGKVDENGSRYLLGDHMGQLYILVLKNDESKVLDLNLEALGTTSSAKTISYLDSSVVFIGSCFGDSQLIKLHPDKDENGSNIEVLETFTNLGPIQDFCVVDLERQGQGQVVTCSGTLKDGSLRVVRNGIGINEQAAVELPGIKGLWSLRDSSESQYDKYLVQSFIGETRVLEITDEELAETEMDGFDHSAQSIWCGNVADEYLVQVTEKSMRLVSSSMKALVKEWSPPDGERISVVAGNARQILLAVGKTTLVYLSVDNGEVIEVARAEIGHEIACLNVCALGAASATGEATLAAVGDWNKSVTLFRLPSLEKLVVEDLGGEVIPRSLLLVMYPCKICTTVPVVCARCAYLHARLTCISLPLDPP
jgi:DNA damage-binding protein 1